MTREKVFVSETDQYLFGQGTHYDIYKKLGAHLSRENGKDGVFFAVWAPNAARVHQWLERRRAPHESDRFRRNLDFICAGYR